MEVTVDHLKNSYAITTTNGNPVFQSFNGLQVSSIFQRTKGKRPKNLPGDNCPMLYALKGIDNLHTRHSSIVRLTPNGYNILNSILDIRGYNWDCIVPMPSSHNIANIMTKRLSKIITSGHSEYRALRKITALDAQHQVRGLTGISSKHRTQLNTFIKKFIKHHGGDADFQMKSITNPALRAHLNPLVSGSWSVQAPPRNILLIDDMVTSGSTLQSASNVIKLRYPMSNVEAITLFSALR